MTMTWGRLPSLPQDKEAQFYLLRLSLLVSGAGNGARSVLSTLDSAFDSQVSKATSGLAATRTQSPGKSW